MLPSEAQTTTSVITSIPLAAVTRVVLVVFVQQEAKAVVTQGDLILPVMRLTLIMSLTKWDTSSEDIMFKAVQTVAVVAELQKWNREVEAQLWVMPVSAQPTCRIIAMHISIM